jgi:predicted transcriptional regulator
MMSRNGSTSILTLRVAALSDLSADFCSAWTSRKPVAPTIAFASRQLLHQTMTPRTLALVKTMCSIGPVGIRELARRVGRPADAVQLDIEKLVIAGLVDRDGGRFIVPFDDIRLELDDPVPA